MFLNMLVELEDWCGLLSLQLYQKSCIDILPTDNPLRKNLSSYLLQLVSPISQNNFRNAKIASLHFPFLQSSWNPGQPSFPFFLVLFFVSWTFCPSWPANSFSSPHGLFLGILARLQMHFSSPLMLFYKKNYIFSPVLFGHFLDIRPNIFFRSLGFFSDILASILLLFFQFVYLGHLNQTT